MHPMKRSTLYSLVTIVTIVGLIACGGGSEEKSGPPGTSSTASSGDGGASNPSLFTAADVTLGDIDPGMVEKGKTTYDVK